MNKERCNIKQNEYLTIRVEELAQRENFSDRTEKACHINGLIYLQDFINYWQQHGTFRMLKYCSITQEKIFSKICVKYALSPLLQAQGLTSETDMPLLIRKLDPVKKIMLAQLIALIASKFTGKTKQLLDKEIQLTRENGIIGLLYDANWDNREISLLGDLIRLKNMASAFILSLITSNDAAQNYLSTIFGKENALNALFNPLEVVDSGHKIKLFKLINLLASSGLLFNPRELEIFQFIYCKTDANIKQKRPGYFYVACKLFKEKSRSYFNALSLLHVNDLSDFHLSPNIGFFVLNDDFIRTINERDGVIFSQIFYEEMLTFFLKSTHRLLTGLTLESSALMSKRKASYFLKHELFDAFKFEDFIAYIDAIVYTERAADEFLNFEEIVILFLEKNSQAKLQQIKSICWIIVLNEYNVSKHEKAFLLIQKCHQNRKKTVELYKRDQDKTTGYSLKEMVLKILEQTEMPATLGYIVQELEKQSQGIKINPVNVQMLILNNQKDFFPIHRATTYGLKIWQKSNKDFKTGTIKALIVECLQQSSSPMQLDDIITYIKQYRMITHEEVLDRLRRKYKETFIFLDDGRLELKKKNLYKDKEGNLKYQYRGLTRAIINILEIVGIPTSLRFIMSQLENHYPDIQNKANSITSLIAENSSEIFHIGRTATYGLRKWEQSGKELKTGSIRTMIIECLEQSPEPMKLDDILAYIRQYRMITQQEFLDALKSIDGKLIDIQKEDVVESKRRN